MDTLQASLRRLERWSDAGAYVTMVLIMLIVVADVALRYAFHRPLTWAFDFISLYLMAAVFYFVLSSAYVSRSLVSIDILYDLFSLRGKAIARLVTNASSLVFFILVCYASALQAHAALMANEVIGGLVPWPTWISGAIVTFGSVLLVVRMCADVTIGVLQLFGELPLVAQPRVHHGQAEPIIGSVLS